MHPAPSPVPAGASRRHWLALCGAGLLASARMPLQAQPASWPSRPIRLVVPFAAGGATDVLGRLLAKAMEGALGQPVVVDNRAGAAGAIGAAYVARGDSDGYSILMGGLGTNVVLEHTMRELPYRPQRDFASVAYLWDVDYVLAVSESSPYQGLADVLDDARKRPGQVRYMSTGPQGAVHVAMEYLCRLADVHMVHVPYKGEALALPDLLERRLELGFLTALSARAHVDTGRLRVLATPGHRRIATRPQWPTVQEQGFAGYVVPIWNGFFVPAATPPAIVRRLGDAVVQLLRDDGLRATLQKQGVTVTGQGAADYERFLQAERGRWKKMIEDSQVLNG